MLKIFLVRVYFLYILFQSLLEIYLTSIILPVYQSACRAAADHCRKKGKSITKLAMQYSLMNSEVSTVLVGMNSSKQVHCFFWTFSFYSAYSYCLMNKVSFQTRELLEHILVGLGNDKKYCYLSLCSEYHISMLPQSKPDVSCEQIPVDP